MGEDEYESLGENVSVSVTMTAGAMAGIMEHCIMFPVDCVKTRMQALVCDKPKLNQSIYSNLATIVREEGIFRPIQGVQAMAMGAGPAHAMYFACYEKMKDSLTTKTALNESVAYGVAGASATLLHDGIMTPADVVKQRMQMCCSPYKSCLECARSILKTEGVKAFYRSYTTQLTMNVPFQSTHFIAYEAMQKVTNREGSYNPSAHLVSGAVAGAVAATVTMPLDVCKTLLNTQEANVLKRLKTGQVVGLMSAARVVYSVAGLPGYFQGLRARVLYQMPSTAISWSVYEFFKHYLSLRAKEEDPYDTLADYKRSVAAAAPAVGGRGGGGGVGVSAEAAGGDNSRLWETITDLPHSVRTRGELVAESLTTSGLINIDTRTFVGRRD